MGYHIEKQIVDVIKGTNMELKLVNDNNVY